MVVTLFWLLLRHGCSFLWLCQQLLTLPNRVIVYHVTALQLNLCLPQMSPRLETSTWTWVENLANLESLIDILARQQQIAFSLEEHLYRSYSVRFGDFNCSCIYNPSNTLQTPWYTPYTPINTILYLFSNYSPTYILHVSTILQTPSKHHMYTPIHTKYSLTQTSQPCDSVYIHIIGESVSHMETFHQIDSLLFTLMGTHKPSSQIKLTPKLLLTSLTDRVTRVWSRSASAATTGWSMPSLCENIYISWTTSWRTHW